LCTEIFFSFTVQITRKCTVRVFMRYENQHRTQNTHTHTHTHTQYIEGNAPLSLFGKHCSLPSRCLTISVRNGIKKQQKFAPRREESFQSNLNVKFLVTEVIDFSSNVTNSFHLSSQISVSYFILRQSQIGSKR
jgi:hypothetical protein